MFLLVSLNGLDRISTPRVSSWPVYLRLIIVEFFVGILNDCSLAREKENPRAYIQYREQ